MELRNHFNIFSCVMWTVYFVSCNAQKAIVCPVVCRCEITSLSIDCSGQDLQSIPIISSGNFRSLNLSHNAIRNISRDDLSILADIESLDLSHNVISYISPHAFVEKRNLQYVNIADNLLVQMPTFRAVPSLCMLDLSRNNISGSFSLLLIDIPNLKHLKMAANRLVDLQFLGDFDTPPHALEILDVSNNVIHDILPLFLDLPNLFSLNLSRNVITNLDIFSTYKLPNLTTLLLNENRIETIRDGRFVGFPKLKHLELALMEDLVNVDSGAFQGLNSLQTLRLHGNRHLTELEGDVFHGLLQLETLDLRSNALQMLRLDAFVLENSNLETIALSGNNWSCDCRIIYLNEALTALRQIGVQFLDNDVICSSPSYLMNVSILDLHVNQLDCTSFDLSNSSMSTGNDADDTTVKVRFSSTAIIECPSFLRNASSPLAQFSWRTNHKTTLYFNDSSSNESTVLEEFVDSDDSSRMRVLRNGSLLIVDVQRYDAGNFVCTVTDMRGNRSAVVTVLLDYDAMSMVAEFSVLVGFLSAFGFFLIAVILGAIRYFAHVCSKEERVKRKSIREVLGVLRSNSHMDRLTAYKTAKLDRFSSFRSATMDQLVAFKTAKIDKLRTYKQATVLSIQQYLDRMREHYSDRTARIKRNCAARSERLRQNYTAQRSRMKDSRSTQMKKIRDNYIARRAKLREYSSEQMAYLHEQYKVQQQHVIKLLELLDIGNCVNVIRDDCERTESIIFDDSMDDLGEYNIGASRSGDHAANGDDLSPDSVFDDEDDDNNFDDDDDDLGEGELDDQITREDQMTMEDILGEIVANVESMQSNSAKSRPHSVGVGAGDGGATSGNLSEDASVVNVRISMRDLHASPTPRTPLVSVRSNNGSELSAKKIKNVAKEPVLETVL